VDSSEWGRLEKFREEVEALKARQPVTAGKSGLRRAAGRRDRLTAPALAVLAVVHEFGGGVDLGR
jgi:hypothetical protein